MSAFLCTPAHIGALAGAYARWEAGGSFDDDAKAAAAHYAATLAAENFRSVAYRYHGLERGYTPPEQYAAAEVDGYTAETYTAACADAGTWQGGTFTAQRLSGMIACYEYQSCECPDYPQTEAYRLAHKIMSFIFYALSKDYERATGEIAGWSYPD